MTDPVDIVITTRNRPSKLLKTLYWIQERTLTLHRVHVIDDCSRDWRMGDTVPMLIDAFRNDLVHHLILRGEHTGVMANLNIGAWSSFSDPTVFVDDDVLCPKLQPDWLHRGIEAMKRRPKLGMLALHHPGAKVKRTERDGIVSYCKSLGGTFLFIRREVLIAHPLPHERGNLDKPMERRCKDVRAAGWEIGVLENVYCQHIGDYSVLTGGPYPGKSIPVKDEDTLEPIYDDQP